MDRKEKLLYAFRSVLRPRQVQGGYFFSAEAIEELVATRDAGLDELLAYGYLSEVMQTAGSAADFAYLLPALLERWSRNAASMPDWNDALVAALAKSRLLDDFLTYGQRDAALEFIRAVILDHMDRTPDELGCPPARWPAAFELVHGYGVYAQEVDRLWRLWWDSPEEGRAGMKVAYLSCLALDDTANPVLLRSGVPNSASVLLNLPAKLPPLRWREANIKFLKQALHPENVQRQVQEVAAGGGPASEIASLVHVTLVKEPWRFEIRAEDLTHYLAAGARSAAVAWRA